MIAAVKVAAAGASVTESGPRGAMYVAEWDAKESSS